MSHIQGISHTVPLLPPRPPSARQTRRPSPEVSGFSEVRDRQGQRRGNPSRPGRRCAHDGQTQDIHRTMVALQQADVSFQLMMQIRNKLVTAYEEIQRMQI